MPETLALLRLSLIQSRWLLLCFGGAACCGVGVALRWGTTDPNDTLVVASLLFTLMPAAIATIVLFDYGHDGDISLPGTACSQWLLRMPVQAWKIAIVPVVLKSLWAAGLWVALLLTLRAHGRLSDVPLWQPALAFPAVAIWVLVIAWRPFRSGWRRIFALASGAAVLYCCVASIFLAPEIRQVQWRPFAVAASNIAVLTAFFGGILCAIQSTTIARLHTSGIIPASARSRKWTMGRDGSNAHPEAHFLSTTRALAHHDWVRVRPFVHKVLLLVALPAVFAAVFVPLAIPSVVMLFVLFADFAAVAMVHNGSEADASQSDLPPYLAVSPLSDARIAWTRASLSMLIAACILSMSWFVFATWACWPSNRAIWMTWASDRAADLGSPAGESLVIGVRWSLAIILGGTAITLTRMSSLLWVTLAGRSWFTVLITVLAGLAYVVPIAITGRWFIGHDTWESVQASAYAYLALVPLVLAVSLSLKGIAVAATCIVLARTQLASRTAMIKVTALWASFVIAVATLIAALVPDPRVSFFWCLSVAAVVTPLARWLICPIMTSWNRHR